MSLIGVRAVEINTHLKRKSQQRDFIQYWKG